MNIPGDTGHPWRLNKFVHYQHAVPPIGPATYLAWAKANKLRPYDCVLLAWLNSTTYCEITALFMHRTLWNGRWADTKWTNAFWEQQKPHLIFTSARRYAKNMDWFPLLMNQFAKATRGQPETWLCGFAGGTPVECYNRVYKELMGWKYMGRFSVELFTDAIVQMSREGLLGKLRFEASTLDWKKGSNVTSGLLNIFYQDAAADTYDETGSSEFGAETYEASIRIVQKAISKAHPKQDTSISVITPKMCSWRNLFKGRRYGGYHHDRQLEQLRSYEKSYPGYVMLWNDIYKLRKEIFAPQLLGEIGGWTGIRKERMKLWLTKGLTGVEKEAQ